MFCRLKTWEVGTVLALSLIASPAIAGYFNMDPFSMGPRSSDFTVLGSKWEPGANTAKLFNGRGPETPGGASWSIMDAGHSDGTPNSLDSDHVGLTSDITSLLGPGANYANMIEETLNLWAEVSGFSNLGQRDDSDVDAGHKDGIDGDIRIAAWEISTPGVLAHAYQPGTEAIYGEGGTIAGDVHFDVNRLWVDDADDSAGDSSFDLFTVMLHELGHALGLGHSSKRGSVMEPIYAGARRALTNDDIKGIQKLYGSADGGGGSGDDGGGGKPPWAGGGRNRLSVGPLGMTAVASAAVPEPSTLVLSIVAFSGLGLCRRQSQRVAA